MAQFLATLCLLMGTTAACPGSLASLHASAEVTVEFAVPCAVVAAEIMARVQGSTDRAWIDPHDAGQYTCVGQCRTNGVAPFTLQR